MTHFIPVAVGNASVTLKSLREVHPEKSEFVAAQYKAVWEANFPPESGHLLFHDGIVFFSPQPEGFLYREMILQLVDGVIRCHEEFKRSGDFGTEDDLIPFPQGAVFFLPLTSEDAGDDSRLRDILLKNESLRIVTTYCPEGTIGIDEEVRHYVQGHYRLSALPQRGFFSIHGKRNIAITLGISPQQRRFSFIGREGEMRKLTTLFETCIRQRKPKYCLINGESGLGKSRLLFEFSQSILSHAKQCNLWWAQAEPETRGDSGFLLGQLLRRQAGVKIGDTESVACEKFATYLYDVYSRTRRSGGRRQYDPKESPDENLRLLSPREKTRAANMLLGRVIGLICPFEGGVILEKKEQLDWIRKEAIQLLADLMEKIARRTPLIIMIDDIHWSDRFSLEILYQAANMVTQSPILLIASVDPLLRHIISGIQMPVNQLSVTLRPLQEKSYQVFFESLYKRNSPGLRDFTDRLFKFTAGNPLFLTEILQLFHVSGTMSLDVNQEFTHPPENVDTILGKSDFNRYEFIMDHLSIDERKILGAASVVGRVFWDKAIQSCFSGIMDQQELHTILGGLVGSGFIIDNTSSVIEGCLEFSFISEPFRKFCYNTLPPVVLKSYHRHFGDWLYSHLDTGIQDRYAQCAHHYERAEELETALELYTAAAERARQLNAFKDALALYTSALTVCPTNLKKRAELFLGNGSVLEQAGRLDEATAVYETSITLAEKAGDSLLTAYCQRACANTMMLRGDYEESFKLYQRCLDVFIAHGNRKLYCQLLGELGNVAHLLGRTDEAMQCYQRKLELADEISDDFHYAQALYGLGSAHLLNGNDQQALQFFHRQLDVLKKREDLENLITTFIQIGSIFKRQAHYQKALEYLHEAMTISTDASLVNEQVRIKAMIGDIFYRIHHYSKALDNFREWLTIAQEPEHKTRALASVGATLTQLGQYSEAMQCLKKALKQARKQEDRLTICYCFGQIGKTHHKLDDSKNAAQYFAQAIDLSRALQYKHFLIDMLIARTHLALESLRDTDLAFKAIEEAYTIINETRTREFSVELKVLDIRVKLARTRKKKERQLLLDALESFCLQLDDEFQRAFVYHQLYRITSNEHYALKAYHLYSQVYEKTGGHYFKEILQSLKSVVYHS